MRAVIRIREAEDIVVNELTNIIEFGPHDKTKSYKEFSNFKLETNQHYDYSFQGKETLVVNGANIVFVLFQ